MVEEMNGSPVERITVSEALEVLGKVLAIQERNLKALQQSYDKLLRMRKDVWKKRNSFQLAEGATQLLIKKAEEDSELAPKMNEVKKDVQGTKEWFDDLFQKSEKEFEKQSSYLKHNIALQKQVIEDLKAEQKDYSSHFEPEDEITRIQFETFMDKIKQKLQQLIPIE